MSLATQAQFINNTGIPIHNSANITTNGDWSNAAGSVITNNGIIQSTESFTNNGALDGSGGFVFSNSTDQTFQTTGQVGFIQKVGSGVLNIDGGIFVRDSLLLDQGVISAPDDLDTLVITSGTYIKTSNGSYVDGQMGFSGTGTITFPFGRAGNFLPLTLYHANASRITAMVFDAPTGKSAGPGVDNLINFPYQWEVFKKSPTDTAAYVEVSYPNTLPTTASPIIARLAGDKYVSMGARFNNENAGIVTVRSYSRGLGGFFTIAEGFASDPFTDSLVLVALFDNTNGSNWITRTNWKSGMLDTWHGITRSGQTITAISLPSNNLNGTVPAELVDILGLQVINLSGNQLTAIPDLSSNKVISSLDVSNNALTFASLEPNAGVAGFNYSPQAPMGESSDELVPVNSSYTFSANAGGEHTTYQWKRNGSNVVGATSSSLVLPSVKKANMGTYSVEAKNSVLTALILTSEPTTITAYANLSGKLLASSNAAAQAGDMTLFRVTQTAFDTVHITPINSDGTFTFEKVVLDNYQLLGFPDTLDHPGALPTYYKNTIFWEEADTLIVEDNINDLNITATTEPAAQNGSGLVFGYVEEEFEDESGRVQAKKRVPGAGVSVRRTERSGKGKEDYPLAAYVFSNNEGEFNLSKLLPGEYKFNIQYPGYPMDSTSFLTLTVGEGLESIIGVQALVANGEITVEELVITHSLEETSYPVEVYPNPALDEITINFPHKNKDRSVFVSDINGKTLVVEACPENHHKLGVGHLPNGFYIINIYEKDRLAKTMKLSIK